VTLRIAQSLTLLPLGSAINRVPFTSFPVKVVVRALRGFPQQGISHLETMLFSLKTLASGYYLLYFFIKKALGAQLFSPIKSLN